MSKCAKEIISLVILSVEAMYRPVTLSLGIDIIQPIQHTQRDTYVNQFISAKTPWLAASLKYNHV